LAASLFQDLDQLCDAMEAGGNAAFMIDIAHARLSVVEELVADGKVEEAKTERRTSENAWRGTLARPVSQARELLGMTGRLLAST
jgi:hypothetical protein